MTPLPPRAIVTRLAHRAIATCVGAVAVAVAVVMSPVAVGAAPTTAREDVVDVAIDAGYVDIGIAPIDDAIEFFAARAGANPADTLSRTGLASALMASARESGDLSLYDRAEAELRAVLAVNPTDEGALLALAGVRAANHDFGGSIALAEQVLARNPSSDAARATIADGHFERGDYELAARELDELAAKVPADQAIDSRRAKAASIRGDNGRAVHVAARALLRAADLDLRPSEAAFYRFQLASYLYQAGDHTRALRALRAGLAIDPDHLASRELEAKVLVSLGRLPAAVRRYEDLVARTPAADLHGLLARAHQALGNERAADAEIAKGLELGYASLGQYPAERRHLASFFAEFDAPTALAAARADFETRQDVGAYDALAWSYYATGDHQSAAHYIDGALAQGTRNASLLYHAGMIEHAVGNDGRAQTLLDQALRLDPRFDLVHAPIARQTLAELSGRAS